MADQSDPIHFIDSSLVRLLPAGSSMRGVVTSDRVQQLLIEGAFEGRISLPASSRIVIAKGGEFAGEELIAHTVVVHGRVNGDVRASVVEIMSTGCVSGSVRYEAGLSVEPGARLRATIEGSDF